MAAPVIKVEGLSKEYRLGVIGHGTLTRDIQSWWARLRGKQDPNAELFTEARKRGDRFMALQDVSFEVQPGERIGIIGRNGAGKSTLLKILSRVTAPTTGRARIKGRVASLLEVGTGFHPELTGRENVYLNGAILGMKRAEVTRKFDEIVEFAGVTDHIDTPVKRYSSGMRVRLGFAVAAHLEPDILIIDEVLAVGDAEFQKKSIGKMEDVSLNQGRTILFVSHNMESIRMLCSSGLLLEEGRIQMRTNNIDDVVEHYFSKIRQVTKGSYAEGEIQFAVNNTSQIKVTGLRMVGKSGNVQTEFDHEDDITVEVDFEVLSANANVLTYVIFKELGGRPVWTGINRPESSIVADPMAGNLLEKGSYRCRVTAPGSTMNEGEYSVDLGLNTRVGYREGCDIHEHLVAKILRPKRLVEAKADRFPGVIYKPMSWQTAKSV